MGILSAIGAIIILGFMGMGVTVVVFDWYKRNGFISTVLTGFSLQFDVIAVVKLFQSISSFLGDSHSLYSTSRKR